MDNNSCIQTCIFPKKKLGGGGGGGGGGGMSLITTWMRLNVAKVNLGINDLFKKKLGKIDGCENNYIHVKRKIMKVEFVGIIFRCHCK